MKTTVKLLLICQLLILPSQCNEDNPFLDLASAFIENMGDGNNANGGDGMAALGSIVGTLMQGDNAKNLGAMLGQAAGNDGEGGGGGGMAALGSIVGTLMQGDNAKNLGAMLGGGQGGENSAGDILSGIGSLLGAGEGEKPKIDPKLLGSMVSMFAQNMMGKVKEPKQKREKREKPESQGVKVKQNFDLGSILNLASGLMGNKDSAGFMPLIMNAIGTLSDKAAEKRAEKHKDHASFLPPYLEKLHLYWDLFINSELGKSIYEKSGLRTVLKAFTGADGSLSFEKMLKNFENQSFRRHWIKAAAKYVTDFVVNVAKPEVYQRYIISAQFLGNSFLKAQGLPESTHFNAQNPEKSITVLVNYVLKKYMDIETDVSEYIKPAVVYIKKTVEMAETATKSMANRGDYNALLDRVTDTLNLEIIEPVLRVYRAYKHSVEAPHCQEHLMCLVNRNPNDAAKDLPGFKAGLTKVSSFAASAALSFQNGKSFWDLYNAIQNDVNCEAAYPADCSAFHEHEMKVTTEVYHSEL